MLTHTYLQQIARQIQQIGVGAFAFCVDERSPTQVYCLADVGFAANTPDSCIVRLVQGMALVWPRDWRNNPTLYFCKSGAVNAMEQAMLRFVFPGCTVKGGIVSPVPLPPLASLLTVTPAVHFNPGTQVSYGTSDFEHYADYDLNSTDVQVRSQIRNVHRIYLMAAYALLAAPAIIPRSYNVAAILVGPRGQILSYGVNQSRVNFACHAEVNALQGCLRNGRAIPPQSILYTTLQPCCMCAGMIDYSMHQGQVIFSVTDTHYNGPSDHMAYVSATPMYELSTVAKPLTTWTTGHAYDKIAAQKEHASLGTAQNQAHQGIERPLFTRYSIIQYLNREGVPFNDKGSRALARKKEKYHFQRARLLNRLNPYVDDALSEVTSFLASLRIPLKTVQEERVEHIVQQLQNIYETGSASLWNYVTAKLLAVLKNGGDFMGEARKIARTLQESPMELEYRASLPSHRGAPLYS